MGGTAGGRGRRGRRGGGGGALKSEGDDWKQSTFAMDLRIVLVTCEPIKTAPEVSHRQASTHAWRRESVRAPTDEEKALATSFAPMPKEAASEATNPQATIQE